MTTSRLDLGHGIGLRTRHFAQFMAGRPPVDWVEAVTENFMAPGGRPISVLEKVRAEVPVVLHGVSLAIGSVDPIPERYLAALQAVVKRIEPALVSDHLCWGAHRGQYVHDLLPLPYTEESLAHVASRVHEVQERLGRQLLLENPSSYVAYRDSSMTEWEFLAELTRRSGCGILLDVNNVHVSAHNHGFDPQEYLRGIPVDRVGYFHLAGHSDKGKYLLDSHDHSVPAAVWELYRAALHRFGRVPSLVEWDEAIPPLDEVVAESRRAAAIETEVLAPAERRLAS
ncbi:MAG: DUF692 domain-containing protein [Deltaproteobacteria bacterium]|nr:DUF692 domain-containing protein [Deltaproteobacteria bacterium]